VVLNAGLRTEGVDGHAIRIQKDCAGKGAPVDGSLRWQSLGGIATCGLAYVSELLGHQNGSRGLSQNDGDLTTFHSFRANAGHTYRLRQITSVVPGILHAQPEKQAARLVAMVNELGFDALRSDNQAEWRELWKSRIKLIGADRPWQELADAAFFYLNSSVHLAAPSSTSIFGLATWKNYHYYYGHVMWDIESFTLPVLSLVQPYAAEAMLNFRFRTLGAAAANAQLLGRRGLQFAWECAPFTGEEAAPLPGTAAWHEDHVTLDVALAFAFHANASGNERFLRERAWPVLAGVAEWLESRVSRTRRGYEIRRSMGIAEREQPSDNTASPTWRPRSCCAGPCALGSASACRREGHGARSRNTSCCPNARAPS